MKQTSLSYLTLPADDFAILAAQSYIADYDEQGHDNLLHSAIAILELANAHSSSNPKIQLSLVRLYRMAGCGTLALGHYTNWKNQRNPSIRSAHHLLERGSMFYCAPMYSDNEDAAEFSWVQPQGDELMAALESTVVRFSGQTLLSLLAHRRRVPQTQHQKVSTLR